ncbi:uncharacterized protein LOC124886620 [Capsicum annuum]|uniref:uncharacterized protein LOC124886620 n=1 Tax=Capsicum annuum TaxID=4072 RepID=UPI001FB0C166|nr:uncharacterized protein LOC124886620 [Capsicum annuum]
MTKDKHKLLSNFIKMKLPVFHGTELEEAYEFIIDCHEKLHQMGVVKREGEDLYFCEEVEHRSLNFCSLDDIFRFVKGFASIATHLMRLTKKDIPFLWSDKCEESFEKLKNLLTTAPILALSVEGNDIIIYYDASCFDLGAVLMKERKFYCLCFETIEAQ